MTDGSHGKVDARRWAVPTLVALATLLADRITKLLAQRWLGGPTDDHRRDLGGGWLGLHYVENRGAAFGTLVGSASALTVVALVVVGGILAFYARAPHPSGWLRLGLGLLVGGALGNVSDRLTLGYVVDFVAVGPWPRFNVADSAITIGVLLLAWRLSRDDTTPARPPRAAHRK